MPVHNPSPLFGDEFVKTFLTALGLVFAGVLGAIINGYFGIRQKKIEVSATVTGGERNALMTERESIFEDAKEIRQELREQAQMARSERDEARKQRDDMRTQIDALTQQVSELKSTLQAAQETIQKQQQQINQILSPPTIFVAPR